MKSKVKLKRAVQRREELLKGIKEMGNPKPIEKKKGKDDKSLPSEEK